MKFKPGDLVERRSNPMDQESPLRYGIIIERYTNYVNTGYYYPELYEVEWSDGQLERGFLPHGLQPTCVSRRLCEGTAHIREKNKVQKEKQKQQEANSIEAFERARARINVIARGKEIKSESRFPNSK